MRHGGNRQRRSRRAAATRAPRRLGGVERLEPRQLLAVVINEFHYDPDDSTELVEFVELHNTGAAAESLFGWRIGDAIDFAFAGGASIAAGGHLVVAQDAAQFQAKFGFTPFGQWETGDKLANDGETIELRNAADAIVDSVSYQQGFPWPSSGEFGSSVELINPSLDNSLAGNWRSSGYGQQTAPQTLVPTGAAWKYRKGTSEPSASWRLTGFSDSTADWLSGTASIGYGDNDDATLLSDMQGNYSTIYLRKQFTLAGPIPDVLKLRLYVDDGAIVSINGREVKRVYVSDGDKDFNDTANTGREAIWEEFQLDDASSYLVAGTNTIAVHVLNLSSGNGDLSFNLELSVPAVAISLPTPGAQNSVFAANSAPQLRDLAQSVQQPVPGQSVVVSMRVTDANGVQSAALAYQLVNPGDYIASDDPRYLTNWTTLAMLDNGTGGDAVADDGVYSATLPGNLQTHRRLIRYRITATDLLGASVTAPYVDDHQPNFAYFVYGETPAWTAAVQPGVTPAVSYDAALLNSVPAYYLITTRQDHVDAQYIPNSTSPGGYTGDDYLWQGALVYDGVVYDHIEYRARGGVWRYAMGKNMWKFDFNRGHDFAARDNYGNKYEVDWAKLNLSAIIQQRDFWHRGEQGLFESVAFKLFNLAGVAAPNTNYVQFRVIENASETGADQYSSDFQGLYLAVEQLDGQFLEQHGLPDGNLYKMEAGTGVGGIGGESNNQGDYPEVGDSSDLINFKSTYESATQSALWWEQNLDLEKYYSYRAIVEGAHHYDIANGKNYFYFHNPDTGKWEVVPWDTDLTWADNMFGSGNEPFKSRVLAYSQYMLAYRNRMREIRDLLYNVEQVGLLVDETAQFVFTPGQTSLVDADRAMWDYNPILASSYVTPSKAGQGQYYAGGGGIPAAGSFAGMMQVVKSYALTRGAWIDANILTAAEEAAVPNKPVIAYAGSPGFPIDGLLFSTSAFSDPNGSDFAKMEWRIGEVSHPGTSGFDPSAPWKYEIDADWESGELSTYASGLTVPAGALEAGHTYRARIRMQDSTGRWSHWSDPVEFLATPGTNQPTLAITELHYNAAPHPGLVDGEDLEFIEVLNTGVQIVNLAGVQLTTFANNPYVFASGLTLAPGQRIVVARDPAVFQSIYGAGINLAPDGYGAANLSNSGETIALATAGGAAIAGQTIAWTDAPPWPTAADGNGPSLEIINPLGNANDPANWRASAMLGGSPGWDGLLAESGDYDANSQVDGHDFLLWQRNLGDRTPALLNGDGSGNRLVDGADLFVWSSNFSTPPAMAAATAPTSDESVDLGGWIFAAADVPPAIASTSRRRAPYRPVLTSVARRLDAAFEALPSSAAWPRYASLLDGQEADDASTDLVSAIDKAIAVGMPEMRSYS